MTNITLSNNVTSIGSQAFECCSSLEHIIIPSSLATLSDSVFEDCGDLETIIIPDSVINIKESAFDYCNSLKIIYYLGTYNQWNNINIEEYNDNLTSATRYYYSETQPTDTTYKYWHYVDGVATAW